MAAAHERNHGKNSCLRIITFEAGHKCRSEIQLKAMTVVNKNPARRTQSHDSKAAHFYKR